MDLSDITYEGFIRTWVRVSLVLILVEAYLTVNKIWIRRHERVVSESVSVSAQLLALATGVPFIGLYVMEGAYEGAMGEGVILLVNVIMILIGVGLWVEGRHRVGFWRNLKRALSLERGEAHTLLSDMFRPVGAAQLIRILQGIASIDNRLDENEIAFIRSFADKWGIDFDAHFQQNVSRDGGEPSFSALRTLVQEYLALSPPAEQAGHLRDIIVSLARIDGSVSTEEQVMIDELGGLIDDYAGGTRNATYAVLVAPQSGDQETALKEILREYHKETRLGGQVYTVGHDYSRAYADMVCGWYRDAGYLTNNENLRPELPAGSAA
jgi:hypothetical protein